MGQACCEQQAVNGGPAAHGTLPLSTAKYKKGKTVVARVFLCVCCLVAYKKIGERLAVNNRL